jgi:hypothetical protein
MARPIIRFISFPCLLPHSFPVIVLHVIECASRPMFNAISHE